MSALQSIINVLMQILTKTFVIFGVRINLLAFIIGTSLLALVGYFIFGIFDDWGVVMKFLKSNLFIDTFFTIFVFIVMLLSVDYENAVYVFSHYPKVVSFIFTLIILLSSLLFFYIYIIPRLNSFLTYSF